MIQTIACVLVAMYGADANRLLLQTTAPVTPATPGIPGIPGVATPAPVATLPPLPVPGAGGAPGVGMPLVEMNCVVPYGTIGSCAAKPSAIGFPADRFKLSCAAYGGCYGSTFNIDIPGTMPGFGTVHDGIETIGMTEPYSGYYSTVNINNPGACTGGNNIKLHNAECKAMGACNGMTYNLLGVDVGDFHCDPPTACMGCTVNFQSCNPMEPTVTMPCISLAR